MSHVASSELTADTLGHVWRQRFATLALGLALLAGVILLARYLIAAPKARAKTVPVITLLDPIRPPTEVKPPEPTKPDIKEVPVTRPIDLPTDPPADTVTIEDTGDENGLAGTRAGTVTDPNRFPGISGGNGGLGFNWYGAALQREVQRYLRNKKSLNSATYVATVRVWLSPAGEVARVEIAGSSGNNDTDESLVVALRQMPALKERPPAELPQPIRLRVSSRA
jgi:protein TonB